MTGPLERLESAVESGRLRRAHGDAVTELSEDLEQRIEDLRGQIEALEEAQQEADAATDAIEQWADEEEDQEARADYREEALAAIESFIEALSTADLSGEVEDAEPEPEPPPLRSPEHQARLDQVNAAIDALPRPDLGKLVEWYKAAGLPARFRELDPDQLHNVAEKVIELNQARAAITVGQAGHG